MSVQIKCQLNPFSNEKKVFESEPVSINEILKKIDTKKAVNTGWRVLINDEIITDFEKKPSDGDTVYIKLVPEGDQQQTAVGEKVSGGVLTAVGIAVAALTGFTGIGAFFGAALVGTGVSLLASGIVLYNTKIPKQREQPAQSPSIRGSKNQARPFDTLPILFGKRRIYADLAANPYTMIDADGSQCLYQLFSVAQKDLTIDINSIKLAETNILEYSATKNINSILSGQDSLVELKIVSGGNKPPFYDFCIHEDIVNEPLKNKNEEDLSGEIIRTTPDNTQEINVDIFFPSGLGLYNSDGDLQSATVKVCAYYKSESAPDSDYKLMGYFSGNTNDISASELKTLRYSVSKKNLAAGKYNVKVVRETEDKDDDTKNIDTVYLGSIRSIKNEQAVSAERCSQMTLVGLKVKASSNLHNYVETLNFVAQSKLHIFNNSGSGAQSWLQMTESSNPAACAIYAMQGELSQQQLDDNDIDWPAFERLYNWCQNKGYECNELVYNDISISELLSSIASTCRAEILRINGKITVIQDIERSGFVQAFTPRNSWDYQERIIKASLPDALSLSFPDADSGYAEQELKIYNTSTGNKEEEPNVIQNVPLWGVTSNVQARKLGMYQSAVARNRPFIHQFSCDFEYMLCVKGDWIKYAGDVALAGITQGRIAELIYSNKTIIGFISDEEIPMEEGKEYAVRIRKQDCTFKIIRVINSNLTSKEIYFADGISEEINEGDLFLFGYPEMDSIDLIITDIQCNDDKTAEIIAVDYSPEIFGVDNPNFVLPDFVNRITESLSETDGSFSLDISDWQHFTTYNDSFDLPDLPPVTGMGNGWHTNYTPNARWISNKTSKSIYDGVWSAPSKTAQSEIKRLWSNHVITLYRELKADEAPLTETGITSNLVYNFATNTIEWVNEEESNGWSLTYPQNPVRPVYVTSATAFGQETTDVIKPSEWAKPIAVGQNGLNGLSMATITMYRRSSVKPQKPAYGGTYNFNTGDFSFRIPVENWFRSIPPLDNESNPIWETHVTALSVDAAISDTQLIDIIEDYEWSDPVQISANMVMSKKEIEQLVKDSIEDASTPYIFTSISNMGFSINDEGYVPVNQSVTTEVHVFQYGEEVEYSWPDLDDIIPPEFRYNINGKELTLTALTGNRISKMYNISIPLIFRSIKEYYLYHETPEYGSSTSDTAVYANIYYDLLKDKPADWDDNYSAYYISVNEKPVLNTSSTWIENTYYKKVIDSSYGYIEYNEGSSEMPCNLTLQGIIGGAYLHTCSTIEEVIALQEKGLIIGDYFTWIGETTASELVFEGQFVQRCNYTYVGGDSEYLWRKDTDASHTANTLPDVIGSAMSELDIAANEQASNYFKKVFGSEIVAKRLVAETGLISEIFSNQITIKGKNSNLGYLRGLNPQGEIGFLLDSNGHAVLNDAEVKGSITAESLLIKSGDEYKNFNDLTTEILNSKNYSTKSDIESNIVRQQMIYKVVDITLGIEMTLPTTPTNYVMPNDQSGWRTSKPTVTSKQALYSCTQYQTYEQYSNRGSSSGVANCTTPSLFGETIIDTASGYIKTNLIKVDTLLADYVKTDELEANYVKTDELEANYIKTNEITSGSGTFTGLKADKAQFTNCTISGKFESQKGIYFQNSLIWGSNTNVLELFNILKTHFPNYIKGNLLCFGTLNFRKGTTLYQIKIDNIRYNINKVGQIYFSCDNAMIGQSYQTVYLGDFQFFKYYDNTTSYLISWGSTDLKSNVDEFYLDIKY